MSLKDRADDLRAAQGLMPGRSGTLPNGTRVTNLGTIPLYSDIWGNPITPIDDEDTEELDLSDFDLKNEEEIQNFDIKDRADFDKWFERFPVNFPKCDCGAEKAKTTHANWCTVYPGTGL